MVQIVLSRALARRFLNASFYTAVRGALHKWVSEPLSVDAVMISIIHTAAFMIPVAKVIKHEIGKSFLDKAIKEAWLSKLAKVVDDEKDKVENGIQTKTWTRSDPQTRGRTYMTTRKSCGRSTAQQSLRVS